MLLPPSRQKTGETVTLVSLPAWGGRGEGDDPSKEAYICWLVLPVSCIYLSCVEARLWGVRAGGESLADTLVHNSACFQPSVSDPRSVKGNGGGRGWVQDSNQKWHSVDFIFSHS